MEVLHFWSRTGRTRGWSNVLSRWTIFPWTHPPLLYQCLFFSSCGSLRGNFWLADQEGRGLVWLVHSSICESMLKIDCCGARAAGGLPLEPVVRGNAPSRQSFQLCTWSFTLCGKRTSPSLEYIWIHGQWQNAWMFGQGPRRGETGRMGSKVLESRQFMDILVWAHSVKTFILHSDSYQRAPTMEDVLNDQINGTSQWTSANLCY